MLQDSSCARTYICDMFLAEGRLPTWPSLFDQVLEEEGGIAFAGVCSSLQAALRLKELYEDETVTQYRAKSTVATFGRTEFKRTALRRATFRLMDVRLYTPIFILAKNRYVCHKGPDIDKGLKEKRKRAHLPGACYLSGDDDSGAKGMKTKKRKVYGGSEVLQMSKRQRHSQLTKKVGCPATLTMYEVLIANCEDADFDDELSWKVRIATQEIELQRFIVVFLPQYHEGHEIGHSSSSCVSRSWHPDVRAKLTSLLIDGVRDPDEMLALLKQYVETSLCATYTTKPHVDDRRYYPLRTDIRNAIAYDLKEKKILIKPNEDQLMELFQQWAEIDPPDGHIFFRPSTFSEVEGQQNLLLVYQNSNQHHLMRRYATELMFVDESTACGIPVFFLSVKTNSVYQIVAFIVLTVSNVANITEALATVKSWNPDVEPRFVMCDQHENHFEAVHATWPNAHLLLCDFCRDQDWVHWLDKEENGLQQHKQKILTLLRQIADASSKEELAAAQHRLVYSSSYVESIPFQLYYTDCYSPVVERWVQYYRHGLHMRIDASSASERREGLMRKHYQQSSSSHFAVNLITLVSTIKQTADAMWKDYCKANQAQITAKNDYELEDAVSHLINRPHSFCNLQLKAYHKAKRFLQQCSDVPSYFKRLESEAGTFLVKDFSSAVDRWHRVELAGEPSCSCSSFLKHKMPCQHFYALFAAFNDVSWLSLPASYRDLAFFTLDPICLELEEGDSLSTDKNAENSESESARNVNMSRLTGLLDKIKASANSADDTSLSSCVRQVEAAATLVESAAPTGKHSADGETVPLIIYRSLKPVSSSLEAGSCSTSDQVESYTTEQNAACATIPEKKSMSCLQPQCLETRRRSPSKRRELTLNAQRLQQRQYAAAATKDNKAEETDTALGDAWIQVSEVVLRQRHRAMIYEELDSTIIAASLALLRADDRESHYSGLLAPSQVAAVEFEGRHDRNLVQVMKVVSEKAPRWICVSTVGCQPAAVDIYDCAFPSGLDEEAVYPHAVKMQIAALLTLPLDQQSVTLHSKPVTQREDAVASGLFAIAFATDLVYYQSVVGTLEQKSLASHLEDCLSKGRLLPFPKSNTSTGGHLSPSLTVEIPIYCKCRLPYSETRDSDEDLMVLCSADSCRIEWYHLRCVGSTDSERKRARECSWYCDWCAAAAVCK